MFEKDIAEGINILNRNDLGWAHRVNIDTLDMGSESNDLLHQICRDNAELYWRIMEDYRKADTFCGFCVQDAEGTDPRYNTLTREWQSIIKRIQKIPADEPFEATTLRSLWEREG